MQHILIKNTVAARPDDWSVDGLTVLQGTLRAAGFSVSARDRGATPDPDLIHLHESGVNQLWLFALDKGDGLTVDEAAGIQRFQQRGGALMITRDHQDMGACVLYLGAVGQAHHFHSHNPEPDPDRRQRDDPFTTDIAWPNYHSGANGDPQGVTCDPPVHPIMQRPDGTALRFLPAHPHEGAVGVPSAFARYAQVVGCGTSRITGRPFNLGVAIEAHEGNGSRVGRGYADASFHHFADYNFDPAYGCPSFVSEPPAYGMTTNPEAIADAKRYAVNIARWLAGARY